MNKNKLEIYAERNPAAAGISLFVFENTQSGKLFYENIQVTSEPYTEKANGYLHPTAVISYEVACQMMDSLWGAGVRPSSGEGNTAHIQALNNHLDDMRKIAFKELNNIEAGTLT